MRAWTLRGVVIDPRCTAWDANCGRWCSLRGTSGGLGRSTIPEKAGGRGARKKVLREMEKTTRDWRK